MHKATKMRIFVVLAAACSLSTSSLFDEAVAQDRLRYPVVFDKVSDLKSLGLVVLSYTKDSDEVEEFPNRCYYYGDGGYSLSFSRDFLARFRARGFSRRSLCFGLISEIRFNPETGTRLPTYIVARVDELRRTRGAAEAGSASAELPLNLPDCFSRALPYSDCSWKYNAFTGRSFTTQQTAEFRRFGERIEQFLKNRAKTGECSARESEGKGSEENIRGYFVHPCSFESELDPNPPVGRRGGVALYDYASVFPKGYGYALSADGTAGPDPDVQVVRQAMDPSRKATSATITRMKQDQ